MRKCVILIWSIVITLSFSSCNYDLYSGKRPYDYGNAKWTCETASAWFIVDLAQDDYYCPEGELQLNGQTLPLKVTFIHGVSDVILRVTKPGHETDEDDSVELRIKGDCVFSPDRLIIKIKQGTDEIFNGEHGELVFIRESIE